MDNKLNLTRPQIGVLVALRVIIGWHLLYEGITKLINPQWSAAGFLSESKGILAGFFHWMASNISMLSAVNFINQWALIIIGIFLIAGFFSRITAYSGMALIILYYIAVPPLIGYVYSMPVEGSYFIVNKNLIEACALLILALIPTGNYIGLDILLSKRKSKDD